MNSNYCSGHTKRGTPCRGLAMPNGKCHKHGGATPGGIASPHFKTGSRSKYMPVGLASKFEAALADPELLAQRNNIALAEARIQDLLLKVDVGDAKAMWKNLQKLSREAQGEGAEAVEALKLLHYSIAKGAEEWMTWDNLFEAMDQQRKFVETEQKRLVAMGQMIQTEQHMGIMQRIAITIHEHVHDKEALRAISEELRKIMTA